MDYSDLLYLEWDESHVSAWLQTIGVKAQYIKKLMDGEVTGPVLSSLQETYLQDIIGMGSGQIQLLLHERSKLLMKHSPQPEMTVKKRSKSKPNMLVSETSTTEPEGSKKKSDQKQPSREHETSRFRKFDDDDKDFRYIKHNILPHECGVDNLISPCHEYKSLETASSLDTRKLKIKFASEVIRFACGCMNMRANGTIHFGVMDKNESTYKHGEIIGIPVKEKSDFEEALDYIENCFNVNSQHLDARRCIRKPKFIDVISNDRDDQKYVIEVDVVPEVAVVREKLYKVRLPKFNSKTNKNEYEPKVSYQRVGPNTARIDDDDLVQFIQSLKKLDQRRETEECTENSTHPYNRENLAKKLRVLLTCGKKYIDNSLNYIIVTNKFGHANLSNIGFLVHMNIFCVLDFDHDSVSSGLCQQYQKSHTVNLHFLRDYVNDCGLTTVEFIKKLQLFDRTSWIFCNGRSDYLGDEKPCDAKTWIKTQKKLLKKTVSVIINEILPKGSFVVLFLLMSEAEQPMVDTFHEFYAEMNGHEDITIISESVKNYKHWSSFAQVSCSLDVLEEQSVVGMPMSQVDPTVQSFQLTSCQPSRQLPVLSKGLCFLHPIDEDQMLSLEIISVNQCEETNLDVMESEQIHECEKYFYQGGKIEWRTLWLEEKGMCGEIIKRDAYEETHTILEDLVLSNVSARSVENIIIYHHAGSGGSTVARQILWNWRRRVRCAVVKQSYQITTVCQNAVQLRNYAEADKNACLPVLLLLEDCDFEYNDDLKREFGNAITTMRISPSTLCFIILNCRRCHDPERMCKALPLRTVCVKHKLSTGEINLFSKKSKCLFEKFEKPEFILTFVLMSKGFNQSYITDFVANLLDKIDHSSLQTRLMRFVALLNSHVENSYLSVSHCEAALGLGLQVDRVRYSAFEGFLCEQVKLIFIHLKEHSTHISVIRIIHPLIAKEILNQISTTHKQSSIAMDLLKDKVLFQHRFFKDVFQKFLRDLIIKRTKKSRGDSKDSLFSPLIEHVVEKENLENAVTLLEAAYTCFGQDAFVAQQLARLMYTYKRFEESKHWAEIAKFHLPLNSFILDTEGQMYKRWFYHQHDAIDLESVKPEDVIDAIDTALKGMEAFKASENAPKSEEVGFSFFGEVDIGCRLLKLLSAVYTFSPEQKKTELINYLCTDYIPEAISKPWHKFHSQLKGLKNRIENALEYICEDLAYFQTDISEEEAEIDSGEHAEHVQKPRQWLMRKTAVFAGFFCEPTTSVQIDSEDIPSEFTKQMKIFQLGGGNVTTILTLLSKAHTKGSGQKLENMIELFQKDTQPQNFDQTQLINFLFCQIALSCTLPQSEKLIPFETLKELSMKLYKRKQRNTSPSSAFFLLSLLFWPEDQKFKENPRRIDVLSSSIEALQRIRQLKSQAKTGRIVTHFFLGKERGLNKLIHRSTIEKIIKGTLSERRLKWLGGEVWTNPDVVKQLRRVNGWTDNGSLFLSGSSKDNKIRVIPIYSASLPNSNENVTFFLGFSFHGIVAYDIQVSR